MLVSGAETANSEGTMYKPSMDLQSGLFFKRTIHIVAILLMCTVFIVGCSVREIREQRKIMENTGTIRGIVQRASSQKGPIIVLRYRDNNGVLTLKDRVTAAGNGNYFFTVIPGDYYIAAFIDSNRDGIYQPGEHGTYHGSPSKITVAPKQTVTVETMIIAGPPPAPPADIKTATRLRSSTENIGRVVPLDDPLFARDKYSLGMWKPLDFMKNIGGGLYFLQEYQPGRVPVLFVHGINGGPDDWRIIIEHLDRERFQPWVMYYPSGLRLDMVSDYMVKAMADLQNMYRFKQVDIIAHSMGGLVTRSFIKKYCEHFPNRAKKIGLIVTINSPMGGMPSAALGMEAPFAVPSWSDVAPGSDFLKDLHTWSWPDYIPYYLVFSYKEGESGDGTVSLQSQLPYDIQSEAVRMYGFNNTHSGTLRDKAFLSVLNELLDESLPALSGDDHPAR